MESLCQLWNGSPPGKAGGEGGGEAGEGVVEEGRGWWGS